MKNVYLIPNFKKNCCLENHIQQISPLKKNDDFYSCDVSLMSIILEKDATKVASLLLSADEVPLLPFESCVS